jgi:hypothetical protein
MKDIVHDTLPKMPLKFVAVLLTNFDVLPILFDFEKRCACGSRNVDSVMRFCSWSTYRRGSADEHRFILKPTPHPNPPNLPPLLPSQRFNSERQKLGRWKEKLRRCELVAHISSVRLSVA